MSECKECNGSGLVVVMGDYEQVCPLCFESKSLFSQKILKHIASRPNCMRCDKPVTRQDRLKDEILIIWKKKATVEYVEESPIAIHMHCATGAERATLARLRRKGN